MKVAGEAVEGLEAVKALAHGGGVFMAVASLGVDAYGASRGSEAGWINVVIEPT
jgi:hypothetical protein